jgi:ABC-type glycerol-3-phosphate transport system substrate-binding protein
VPRRAAHHAGLILFLALAACAADSEADTTAASEDESSSSGDEPRSPADLVEPTLWVHDDAADPMPAHRPGEVECTIGFGEEFGVFEIDTESCNYGVFSQPMLAEVRAGDTVELTVTHDDLVADGPAIGHVLVSLGDAHSFDEEVEIPHAYGLVTAQWVADVDVPAGTPAVLHLHNHGFNQWRLVAIVTRPPV